MKSKKEYILSNGEIDGKNLRVDFYLPVFNGAISMPDQLKKFFDQEEFTKKEMGVFTMAIIRPNGLSCGVPLLLKALNITTEEQAATCRIFEDYMEADINVWDVQNASWMSDYDMGWPFGTLLPSSKAALDEERREDKKLFGTE